MEPTQPTIKTHDELPLDVIAQALGLDPFAYEFSELLSKVDSLREAEAAAEGYKELFQQLQRKPAVKRERFELAGQREFFALLAPYLPYGIDVFHPTSGQYGRLLGLPYSYSHQGEPVADVEMYVSAEGREDGGGDLDQPFGKLLPVLYGFEDLATPMEIEGRLVEPAIELVKLLPDSKKYNFEGAYAGLRNGGKYIEVVHENGSTLATLYPDDFGVSESSLKTSLLVATKLRSLGFAVGLAPEQYHRRQVGFDYASGEKPGLKLLDFGEPLPPVTPCPSGRNDCPSGCPKCPAETEVARA